MRNFLFLVAVVLLQAIKVFAQCDAPTSVTAVVVSHERCLAKGVIAVSAINPTPASLLVGDTFQYRLLDASTNAEVRGWQNSDTFQGGSVPAGSYKIEVRKKCEQSVVAYSPGSTQSNSVTVLNQLAPVVISSIQVNQHSYCDNGRITVVANGRNPLSYALVDGISSNVELSPRQSSNQFSGLGSGTHYVRVFDSCDGYNTASVIINAITLPTPSISSFSFKKYGCDSFVFTFNIPSFSNVRADSIWIEWPSGISNTLPLTGGYVLPFTTDEFATFVDPNLPFPQNVGASPKTFIVNVRNFCNVVTSLPLTIDPSDLQLALTSTSTFGCDSAKARLVVYHNTSTGNTPAFQFYSNNNSNTFIYPGMKYSLDNGLSWETVTLTDYSGYYEISFKAGVNHDVLVAYCEDTVRGNLFVNLPSPVGLTSRGIQIVPATRNSCNDVSISFGAGSINSFNDSVLVEIVSGPPGFVLPPPVKIIKTTASTLFSNLPFGDYRYRIIDSLGLASSCPRISQDFVLSLRQDQLNVQLVEHNVNACKGFSGLVFRVITPSGAQDRNVTIAVLEQPNGSSIPTSFQLPVPNFAGYLVVDELKNLKKGTYRFLLTDSVGLDASCIRTLELSHEITDRYLIENKLVVNQSCDGALHVIQTDTLIENGSTASGSQHYADYKIRIYNNANVLMHSGSFAFGGALGERRFDLSVPIYSAWPSGLYKAKVFLEWNGNPLNNDSCAMTEVNWEKIAIIPTPTGSIFFSGCNGNTANGTVVGEVPGIPASDFTWAIYSPTVSPANLIAGPQASNVFTGLNISQTYAIEANYCGAGQNAAVTNAVALEIAATSPTMRQCVGEDVTFTVPKLDGVTYVWYKNNVPIQGADTHQLVLNNIQTPADVGDYHVSIMASTCELISTTFELLIDCSALPIKLANFNAYAVKNTAQLKWSTLTEIANKGFDIEHSVNGSTWNSIGFVNTLAEGGNSNAALNYQYTHLQPAAGVNYYRLKQVDFDGTSEYSKVRTVNIGSAKSSVVLYPNPANTEVTIQGLVGNETIVIFDVVGREMLRTQADQTAVTISLEKLVSGTYRVQVQGEYDVQSLPLIKNAND